MPSPLTAPAGFQVPRALPTFPWELGGPGVGFSETGGKREAQGPSSGPEVGGGTHQAEVSLHPWVDGDKVGDGDTTLGER